MTQIWSADAISLSTPPPQLRSCLVAKKQPRCGLLMLSPAKFTAKPVLGNLNLEFFLMWWPFCGVAPLMKAPTPNLGTDMRARGQTHTHTCTQGYIYIYIYMSLCVCIHTYILIERVIAGLRCLTCFQKEASVQAASAETEFAVLCSKLTFNWRGKIDP